MENGGSIFLVNFVIYLSTQLRGITKQKKAILKPTVVKTSNLT
jgi:hypothetical protein